jgi:catechol 2,3-dioxygenase-like lactoylglutathione lyase family enzyme
MISYTQRLTSRLRAMLVLSAILCSAGLRAQTRPAITGLAFVRITTADAKASRAFYETTLGFQAQPQRGMVRYAVDDLQWFEVQDAEAATAPASGRLAAIGFNTRDAAALQIYLRSHGVKIAVPMHDKAFAVHDPEGRLVYFVQQHPSPAPELPHALSHRMIHTGFVVRDPAKENSFYQTLLGFHLYWQGGMKDGDTDWVNMQAPDGTDCVEYMLHQAESPGVKQLGIMNHFALGVADMARSADQVKQNGCAPGAVCEQPHFGREGKMQMNLYDPDGTRVELMEFVPTGPDHGAPFTGRHPNEKEDQ